MKERIVTETLRGMKIWSSKDGPKWIQWELDYLFFPSSSDTRLFIDESKMNQDAKDTQKFMIKVDSKGF